MYVGSKDAGWNEIERYEQEIIELENWLEEHEQDQYLLQREFDCKLKRCDDLYHEVDELRRQLNREDISRSYDSCSMIGEQNDEETLLSLTASLG